jgi:hypothetical protein
MNDRHGPARAPCSQAVLTLANEKGTKRTDVSEVMTGLVRSDGVEFMKDRQWASRDKADKITRINRIPRFGRKKDGWVKCVV